MALLVADVRTESFEKPPPPKKKWIQDYLEKTKHSDKVEDGDSVEPPPGSVAGVVQVVIDQFQDYIHETSKRNLEALKSRDSPSDAPRSKTNGHLLNAAEHGTKFNCNLLNISNQSSGGAAELQPLNDPDQFSQHDIGGVVQGVISSFLNGNLGDSNFRLSRKRCKRQENASSGGKDRRNNNVKRRRCSGQLSEIASNGQTPSFHQFSDSHPEEEEEGVLNLSLPKASSKVTFATEDRCYGVDSLRSSKTSKSQEMYNKEALEHKNNLLLSHSFPVPGSSTPPSAGISPSQGAHESPTLQRIQTSPPLQKVHAPQNMYPLVPSMSIPQTGGGSPTKGFLVPKPLASLLQVPEPARVVSTSPVNLVMNHKIYKTSQPYSVIQPPPCSERISSEPEEHIPRHIQGSHAGGTSHYALESPHHPPQAQIQHPPSQRWSPIIVSTFSKSEPLQLPQHDAGQPSQLGKDDVQRDAVPPPPPPATVLPKNSAAGTKQGKTSAGPRKDQAAKAKEPVKPKQKPDAAGKDKKTSSGYTREMHNIMEKNRRAQLKQCFDEVAILCQLDPKKTSNLSVIRSAFKFIMRLRREARDQETELANLAKDKVRLKQRLEKLKTELPGLVAKNV